MLDSPRYDNQPFFSIVMPLYNKEIYIQRAINSVLMQTYENLELLIINDGSTDNSEHVVYKFKDKRIALINQQNSGAAAARNRGIAMSHGQYIAFLDADDEWLPGFLETIYRLINQNNNAGIFATAYEKQGCNHKLFNSLPDKEYEGIILNYLDTLIQHDALITSSSVCIKKEVFDKVGNFNISLKKGEDIDMWLRVALNYEFAFSSKIESKIYLYTLNNSDELYDEPYEVFRYIKSLQDKLDNYEIKEENREDYKNYISKLLIYNARQFINTDRRLQAIRVLLDKRTNRYFRDKMYVLIIALIPRTIKKNIQKGNIK